MMQLRLTIQRKKTLINTFFKSVDNYDKLCNILRNTTEKKEDILYCINQAAKDFFAIYQKINDYPFSIEEKYDFQTYYSSIMNYQRYTQRLVHRLYIKRLIMKAYHHFDDYIVFNLLLSIIHEEISLYNKLT